MSCSIITTVVSRGMAPISVRTASRSSPREAGERLVQQQQARRLRERQRDLEAAPVAVRDFRHAAPRLALEPHPREDAARRVEERRLARERPERVPAGARKAQQREHHVVLERVVREERDDLVGAREPAARALVRLHARDLAPEDADRARVAAQVAGDEVEERGLAGAVGPDDEPALARHHLERDVVRRRQPAEGLAQSPHRERRRHGRGRLRATRRRTPGTIPCGMKITMPTNTNPSSMFQRSTYAEA